MFCFLVWCGYLCGNILTNTESVAYSRQTNVGNSTEERVSKHLAAFLSTYGYGRGVVAYFIFMVSYDLSD